MEAGLSGRKFIKVCSKAVRLKGSLFPQLAQTLLSPLCSHEPPRLQDVVLVDFPPEHKTVLPQLAHMATVQIE